MSLFKSIENKLKGYFVKSISNVELSMLVRERFDNKASNGIVPMYTPQRRVTLSEWEASIELAKNPHTLNRFQLYRVYDSAMLDLHLESVVESRIAKAQTARFRLVDAEGDEDVEATALFHAQWFRDFIRYSIEANFYGFSLMELSEQSALAQRVKTNRGNFTVKPLKRLTLINRKHVRPEYGKWTVNSFDLPESGYSYLTPPDSNFYIPIGKPDDLGLLAKIAPVAIAKRYSQGAWSEFNEKLGIPFRTAKMQGNNKERERLLGNVLTNMGSAGWAILHPGEEIELMQSSGSDVHKCFLELADFCDKQMSKAILGQTMTTDNGGSMAQAKVHKEVADDRHEADRIAIEYAVNEMLIPRLILLGYPLEGYRYQRYDRKEESLEESIKKDSLLFANFNISPEYVAQKYGIPIEQITSKVVATKESAVEPDVQMKFNPSQYLPKYNLGCCEKNWAPATMQDISSIANPYTKEIESLYDKIYNKEEVVQVPANVALEYAKPLINAYLKGLGAEFEKPVYNSPDNLRIAMAEANIARFSSAATFKDVITLNELARKAKNYNEFKENATAYSKAKAHHLKTEYDTAFAVAQNAAAFQRQIAEADEFDLQYQTIMDNRVRQSHAALDGFTAKALDPIWDIMYPPNGWNCRCEVIQIPKGSAPLTPTRPNISEEVVQKGFRFNPGKSYTVFENTVSYLKEFDEKKKLNPKVYGLPTSQQLIDQDKSGLEKLTIPKWNKEQYDAWWLANQKEDGNVYLKNYLGVNLFLDKEKLKDKFLKDKYEGENRYGIANALNDILTKPDEVWVQYNNSSRAKYRASYLKTTAEGTFVVTANADTQKDSKGIEVITWYQVYKDNASALGDIRNGLIVKNKAKQ